VGLKDWWAEQMDEAAEREGQAKADKAKVPDLKAYIKAHKKERVAELKGINVFPDRIIKVPSLVAPTLAIRPGEYPLDGAHAEVTLEGSVDARTTLTRSLVPGMHGWQKKMDNREVWLTITAPEFEWVVPAQPGPDATLARQFAAALNVASRKVAPQQEPPAPTPAPASAADELRKLAELRDAGTLTSEEFAAAKQRLLDGLAG
jgi:hypothetical protein